MPDFEDPKDFPPIAHVVVLLDESGSMGSSRELTLSSLNEYISGLRATLPGDSLVTINKFTTDWSYQSVNTVHHRLKLTPLATQLPLKDVPTYSLNDYKPSYGTPLLDALGETLTALDSSVKERPGPVFFAVLTDGNENESTKFKLEHVKGMVEERSKAGWTFAFIGVDIDAFAESGRYGFTAVNTIISDRESVGSVFTSTSKSFGRKYVASTTMDTATYAMWNSGDATYTDDDRAKASAKRPKI